MSRATLDAKSKDSEQADSDVADLAAFTGNGNAVVSYSYLGQIDTSLTRSQVDYNEITSSDPFSLSYTYITPAPAATREPSASALLGVGLLGLSALGMKARRRLVA